jgi:hypothetical protein
MKYLKIGGDLFFLIIRKKKETRPLVTGTTNIHTCIRT